MSQIEAAPRPIIVSVVAALPPTVSMLSKPELTPSAVPWKPSVVPTVPTVNMIGVVESM